jgi:hypothetical protein
MNIEEAPGGTGAPSKAIAWPMKREVEGMGQTQGLKPHPAAFVPTLQGRSVRHAVCYTSGMELFHATVEEFAAHV